MKILFKIITMALLMGIGYLVYITHSKIVAISGVVGLFAGIFYMQSFILVLNDKIKSYKRQVEKIDISDSENSSKVEVLEQKIVVLEKALKNALENNNN